MPNTHFGAKVFISSEDVSNDLTQTEFEALTWVEATSIIDYPAMGYEVETVDHRYIGADSVKKSKTYRTPTATTISFGEDNDDLGQIEFAEAAVSRFGRGIKIEGNDKPDATGTNTIKYSYGKITSHMVAGGDGNTEVTAEYGIALEQVPIIVKATAGA